MRGSRIAVVLLGIVAPGAAAADGKDAPPLVIDVELPALPQGSDLPLTFEAGKGLQGFAVRVGSGDLRTPAVDGESVFIGSGNEMRAYQCLGGRLKWKTPTDDSQPSSPAVAGGRVYFNTQSCTVYAMDAATGERKWSQWVAGSVATTPAVSGDVVFVSGPDADGGAAGGFKLEAYAAASGKKLFKSALRADVITAPVVKDGRVFFALGDGTVAASDLSGKSLWETKGEALAAPCPHEGRLLVASGKEPAGAPSLVDLDAATGSPGRAVATPPGGSGREPSKAAGEEPGRRGGAAPGRPVPKPGPSGKPQAGPRKTPEAPRDPPLTPPTPPSGSAGPVRGNVTAFGYEGPRPCVVRGIVAMSAGDTLLLQPAGGGETTRVSLDRLTAGAPVAAGRCVLQATRDGRLFAVDAASGRVEFVLRFTCGGKWVLFNSSPVVSRGRAYLGTGDGVLVGVDLPDPSLDGWPMWGGSPERSR